MNEKGKPVMNLMQMLHRVYNIQNWQKSEELKELWYYLCNAPDEKFKRLEELVLTRW